MAPLKAQTLLLNTADNNTTCQIILLFNSTLVFEGFLFQFSMCKTNVKFKEGNEQVFPKEASTKYMFSGAFKMFLSMCCSHILLTFNQL